MAGDSYLDLVGQGFDDLDKLEARIKDIGALIKNYNGDALQLFNVLKGNKSFAEFSKFYADAKKLIAALRAEMAQYEKATVDQAKAQEILNRTKQKNNQETQAEANSINAAKQAIKELTKERNNLNLATAQGQARLKAINDELDRQNKLLRDNGSEMEKQRANIGNYKSHWDGLGHSVQQVARELPSLTNGFNQFFLAISNNLPQLSDELKLARLRNEELAASGQKGVPIWKQMAGAIINWQTALVVGITLLAAYGDEIKGAILGTTEISKAQKKYADSLKSIETNTRTTANEEIAHIKVLESLATTTDTSTKAKKAQQRAIDELQKLYPQTLKDYDDEAIKAGNAAGAITELTNAILSKAAAEAAEKKFGAASEKVYDLLIAQRNATKEVEIAQLRYNKALNNFTENNKFSKGEGAIATVEATKSALDRQKKSLDAVSASLAEARKEQSGYLSDAQQFAKDAGQAFINETPDKKTKTGAKYDPTNDQINAQERLNKALAELKKVNLEKDINDQQTIFNNEKAMLSERLAAHGRYISDKLKLLQIDKDTELSNIQVQLDKISEIEGKSAGKRTNAEKKLLQDKEALEAEKAAVVAKYQIKQNDVLKEGGDFALKTAQNTNKQIIDNLADFSTKMLAQHKAFQEKERAIYQETANLKKKFYQDVASSAMQFADLVIAHDMKILDQRSSNLDAQHEVEVARIEATATSAQDAADKKYAAEQELYNQKKQIEKEKEALDRRRFEIEKGAALAKILIDATTAVSKIEAEAAVLAATPATAALAANALAQIPFVIGSAAVAAGLVAAQLLAYAEGTDNHPGGGALIGEAGESELVKEPGKSPYWVNKPTIFPDLPAGTQVIPMHDMVAASGAFTPGALGMIVNIAGGNSARVEQLLEQLLSVQQNQPIKETHIGSDGWSRTSIIQGTNKVEYLKKHIYGK